ncbi:MAG: response regulator transcription factor [Anaerolineae bacterium]
MPKHRVLVIDDEPVLCKVLQDAFTYAGYDIVTAANGPEGLRQLYHYQPDLVILDVMMPEMSGWEVCQQIRQLSDVPVIMLTALASEHEIIHGLDCGADDYVTKPFSPTILLARTEAIMRRVASSPTSSKPVPYNDGYLTIDLEARRVFVRGQPVKLSSTEYRLLTFLFQHAGKVLTFQQILSNIWGELSRDNAAYVHTYIWGLRQKLEPNSQHPTYIFTEHGVGYSFEKRIG